MPKDRATNFREIKKTDIETKKHWRLICSGPDKAIILLIGIVSFGTELLPPVYSICLPASGTIVIFPLKSVAQDVQPGLGNDVNLGDRSEAL
ncbi:hypothetical protein PoB_001056300 [Plakobranchus ocellatus]|uniref:Uncharacterized protein n=1 Tax=Plakobranchus ocellatus TaxID=259542 RepID=A0AAV3YNY9_9GAST|nr:hypothetical protein PoB_001056300 [Plakobranchus ocellatus]